MKDYLAGLTRRYLSKRQAILVQLLDRCMSDLERIGDHIEPSAPSPCGGGSQPEAVVDRLSFSIFFQLYETVLDIFKLLIRSFDPDRDHHRGGRRPDPAGPRRLHAASLQTRTHFNEKVSQRAMTPTSGIFFSEYIAALDRIVRHARNIAYAEKQPQFWIKRSKLEKFADFSPAPALQPLVNPSEYLSRLPGDDEL
jgi:phosphate:Na+ symporter